MEPGNLGDVPNKMQKSKIKMQNYKSKFKIRRNTKYQIPDTKFSELEALHHQRLALSGGEPEKQSDTGRDFTGIRERDKIKEEY